MVFAWRLTLCGLLALLLAVPVHATDKIPEHLALKYQDWLRDVEPLISKQERQEFLKLEQDYQRDAFIKRFWQARDPYPATDRNEFRDRYYARLDYARETYGNLTEDRARILVLNGEPAFTQVVDCPSLLWPLELWLYKGSDQIRSDVYLLFYRDGDFGTWRLWYPTDGALRLTREPPEVLEQLCPGVRRDLGSLGASGEASLAQGIRCVLEQSRSRCPKHDEVLRTFLPRLQLEQKLGDFFLTVARLEERPEPREGEWLANFAAYSTELPEGAATFPAELELAFPGRDGFRTVVQAVLRVPVAEASTVELVGRESYNFQLTGEVLRDAELFESFRYKFDLPAAAVTGDTLTLAFQRSLRAGSYRLVLKLEDLNSGRYQRLEQVVEVPRVEEELLPPPPDDPETARLLAEANRLLDRRESQLKLVHPKDDVNTGMVRFDTVLSGDQIVKATFYLNGNSVLTKKRPPYSVELDLGSVPRRHRVRVEGFDAEGQVIASDELELNAGRHRFAVHLTEPKPGQTYKRSLLARANVDVPEGGEVERLEIYLNETLVATLYQPPWVQPVLLDAQAPLAYVRAVAYQRDGNTTEDLVFINSPGYLEQVDVQFVELYATALDRDGRPVAGLTAADFEVREDGAEQTVVRFEPVRDVPIYAGILLDTSASMAENLVPARTAALSFFQQVITPRDRAAVVTFNDRPNLAVKFTSEIDSLAAEMAGLKAERGTALWDSLVFTLYYFNGIKGQRAVLLLSDGKDESSRYSFDEALSYAQTAGVTLYTIGLDLPFKELDARLKLSRLAEATGGRSYFIDDVAELAAIYDQIQAELRAKYLLAYQSTNTGGSGEFRRIEVRARGASEVKALQGYYP